MPTGNDCACCQPPWAFRYAPPIPSHITTRGLNSSGVEQWNHDHGSTLLCCFLDDAGFSYIGGLPGTDGYSVRKHDPDGNVMWSAVAAGYVKAIEADASGNVYALSFFNVGQLWKYNSDGVLQWVKSVGATGDVSVDASDNVYTVGEHFPTIIGSVRKYEPTAGNLLLTITPAGKFGVSIAANGDIYSVTFGIFYRYDAAGNLLWSKSISNQTKHIDALSNSGGCVVEGLYGIVRKFDAIPTEDTSGGWPLDHGAALYGLSLDSVDNVYIAGTVISDVTNRKYDTDGNEQWTFNHDTNSQGKTSNDISANSSGNSVLVGERT